MKVKQLRLALEDAPEFLKNLDLCTLAVTQNGRTLQFVPDSLKSLELCTLAVKL